MIATILSLALAGFMFKLVFNAFRDGEAWVKGESGSWFAEKEKNPVLFYFTVAGFFSVGVIGLVLAYKNITGSFPDTSIHEAAAIHGAAAKGDIEAVKQHLNSGVDVEARGPKGEVALHFAALRGRKEIVELLITAGANVNAKAGAFGKTPLDGAISRNQTEIADLLRKHGGKTSEELKAAGK